MKLSSGAVLISVALLAGCQATGHQSSQTMPAQSGFLDNYAQLKPAEDKEGVMLYLDKSGNYRPYTKIMFEPVQVLVTPSEEQAELPREAKAKMSSQFQSALRRALEPAYQVVATPGPDVLRVRSAITGMQAAKPKAGAIDYLPIKAVYNVGREAADKSPRVAEMTGEMEVLDPNGKRIAAAMATRRGDKTLPQGEQVTWESLQPIFDYWAKGFRTRLDELRGVSTASR